MNRKAQMGLVMYVIIAVFAAGFVLWSLTPALNDVRAAQLAQTPADSVLMTFILYMLIPMIWFFYVILSMFAINAARDQTQ
jgi:hypothetical protein